MDIEIPIGSSSRKRKQQFADVDEEYLCQELLNHVQEGTSFTSDLESTYGRILERLTTSTDCKFRRKIAEHYAELPNTEPEQVMCTLRAYPIFIKWLLKDDGIATCRWRVTDHMFELITDSGVIEDEEYKNKRKPVEYEFPEQLMSKLRPYATFLKWLKEEEEVDTNDKDQQYRSNLTATIFASLNTAIVDKTSAQKGLNIAKTFVILLKNCHEEGTPKMRVLAGKKQTSAFKPMLDALSEKDRKLLTRFGMRYWDVARRVLDEFREYEKQLMESKGFDIDAYPGSFDNMTPIHPVGLFAFDLKNIDYKKLAELAIKKFARGKIKFKEAVRVNVRRYWRTRDYYVTFLGHCGKSFYHCKTRVVATLNKTTDKENYEILSFESDPIELGSLGLALDKDLKKSLCETSLTTAQILESHLKVNNPQGRRVTRSLSKSITQLSESKNPIGMVSYNLEGESSNHSICEKHWKELSLLESFIDMPEDKLLLKFQEADRSTGAQMVKELRQYFEQVSKSEGFHIDKYPGFFPGVTSIIKPINWSLWSIGSKPVAEKLAEFAIQNYNDDNGTRFEFVNITEVNVSESMHYHFYINFLAHVGDHIAETFEALVLVNMCLFQDFKLHFCRIVASPNN